MSAETTSESDCDCKAGRVATAHALDDFDRELEQRWLGDGRERESLRSLADYANRRVLRAAMREAGMEVIDGEVENTYRLLTDSDTSAGDRTQVERRLERAGVDVDDVESSFVSHQTIHTHLRECRGVSREEADRDRVESARRTIFSLQSRTEAVVEDSLSRLAGDELSLAGVDAFVDIQVLCESCGRQHEVGTLIDRGGCQCQLD